MPAVVSRLLVGLAIILGAAAPAFADGYAPRPYEKKATWAATMVSCREACREAKGRFPVTLGVWYATRPIPVTGFAEAAFPEQGVNLETKIPSGKPAWDPKPDYTDSTVISLAGKDCSSTYLYRVIKSEAALTLPVSLGSDDGLEVWLNGKKILSNDVPRIAAPDQERIGLALHKGENTLLLKVFNISGGCGFYFGTSSDLAFAYIPAIERDFPRETGWLKRDLPREALIGWFLASDNTAVQTGAIEAALRGADDSAQPLRAALNTLVSEKVPCDDARWFDLLVRAHEYRADYLKSTLVDFAALRRAVSDLATTYADQYTKGKDYLARLDTLEKRMPEIRAALAKREEAGQAGLRELAAFQREVLLANPLLNFDKLLLVKRGEGNLGLPQNWQGNCALSPLGYDNEIATLAYKQADAKPESLYHPKGAEFVGDVDLHFDADKMLFSMPGENKRWQIWEVGVDGSGLRQVTPGAEPDVDNYDACYLPNGKIVFDSTRAIQGIPCVGGSNAVANLCLMEADGSHARQLCFDQDHDWCPTLLNNGRIMYSRWEYSDTSHYFTRLLFHMNPDGTNQAEYYGSNSFWPNSIFYARPIPEDPSKFVAIVSGHHGVPRMGELVVFDPSQGRVENHGVVQRIPGFGKKVEATIADTLVDESWPKFLHPYPLNDKYFLVSCKPNADAQWGLYLVDVFDNMVLLSEQPGYALFEPVPLRKTPRPPVIVDRVKPEKQTATVYLTDIYRGQGLKGVPRGTVKALRLYEIYYCYPEMGGHYCIGMEGPWDAHRILGTVPVYEDGSAFFTVPSNMPIAAQPLDDQGRAIQLMRSWFTAMPGEAVSCVGCHERQNMVTPAVETIAARRTPSEIEPWKGPARGFSYNRDVQPVLDRFCVGCHDGAGDRQKRPNLARNDKYPWNNLSASYLALHPYVRRPGPESETHVQKPMEFCANTSALIRMLDKGHHGVKLDQDAWDRLYTWIDLNVPFHGTWGEQGIIKKDYHERRMAMRTQYANRPEDPEAIPELPKPDTTFVKPAPAPSAPAAPKCKGWPFDAAAAAKLQAAATSRRTVDLGGGVTIDMVLIPAGQYVMGNATGASDEWPQTVVTVDAPFWMATTEITNAQYHMFDPEHDNRFIDQHYKDHTTPGYSIQDPKHPAVRLSWDEAMAFCRWLSDKAGAPFALPTEAQWEWACRAGAETPFWYGGPDTDFGPDANLADKSLSLMAVTGINPQPIKNPTPYEDFLPKDARFDDGAKIMSLVAQYKPNPWGLYDMHGNAAEWTLSKYRPYPYVAGDGREATDGDSGKGELRVARGGSWADCPKAATASYRYAYKPWQPVYNVGFRVVCPASEQKVAPSPTVASTK